MYKSGTKLKKLKFVKFVRHWIWNNYPVNNRNLVSDDRLLQISIQNTSRFNHILYFIQGCDKYSLESSTRILLSSIKLPEQELAEKRELISAMFKKGPNSLESLFVNCFFSDLIFFFVESKQINKLEIYFYWKKSQEQCSRKQHQ